MGKGDESGEELMTPYMERSKFKIFMFISFLVILALLIYTAFFGDFSDFSFTGGFINNGLSEDINKSTIKFNADLNTIPELELDGEFQNIKIEGKSPGFFYVGDQKFPLEGLSFNNIVLNEFEGKIYFDKKNISTLNGYTSKVIFNGIPITSKSGKDMKVYFEGGFDYTFLEIIDGVFIKKLNYKTSGKIILNEGKNIFEINDDDITISKFYGDLKSDNRGFSLNGNLEKLVVVGENSISVSI